MNEELTHDKLGRNLVSGKFEKGFAKGGPGRPKGSRNKMTQMMLNRVHRASEAGLSPEDVMIDLYQDPTMPADLRFKAAAKVADLIYPKAASIEVKMEDSESMTVQQIDDKLRQLLALSQNSEE